MRYVLNTITQHKGRDYKNMIWEYSLTEAWFTKNRDYITANNSFISQKLQMKIREI